MIQPNTILHVFKGDIVCFNIQIHPAGSYFSGFGERVENRLSNFDLQNLWHYKSFPLLLPAGTRKSNL